LKSLQNAMPIEDVQEEVYQPKTNSYIYIKRQFKIPYDKPTITWWRTGDPNTNVKILEFKLGDINVIRCKYISDEFREMILRHKEKIYLHYYVTGLNQSIMEPNIPSVRDVFNQLKALFDAGFPQRQVLVVVDPIIPNDNGLKVLELILRLFTEFDFIRLRKIRLLPMWYKQSEGGKYVPANRFVMQRPSTSQISQYLVRTPDFNKKYFEMMGKYNAIICVDNGEEAIIGVRELNALGYKNEWIDKDGHHRRIIEYKDKAKKWEPDVKVISGKSVRCHNRCLLCPFFG